MKKPISLSELERTAAFMDLPDGAEPIWFVNKDGDLKLDVEAMVHRMLCEQRDPELKHLWAN